MYEFLRSQLNHNQFFSAAVAASIMGGLIIWLKSVPIDIYKTVKRRILFKVTIFQNDPLYDDFEAWFFSTYANKYRDVEAGVKKEKNNYSHPETSDKKDVTIIYYKQIDGFFIIRYRRKILFIQKGREKLDHASDIRSIYFDQYHISSFFGMSAIKSLLAECVKLSSLTKKVNEVKLFTHNTYGEWYSCGYINARKIEDIVLPVKFKEKLFTVLDNFINSKDWYNKAAIFYKLGLMLHGIPGNGKTTLAIAIANYLGRDLYMLDLNSINENHMLKSCFANIGKNGVLLTEDIDGFFHLRIPVKKDSKLSFSTFLNCYDGLFYKEGLISIITTNNIHLVDPALMRKGRMDFVEEVEKPGQDEVLDYLIRFFKLALLEFTYESDYSMCDIQALCMEYQSDLDGLINHFKNNLKEKEYAAAL